MALTHNESHLFVCRLLEVFIKLLLLPVKSVGYLQEADASHSWVSSKVQFAQISAHHSHASQHSLGNSSKFSQGPTKPSTPLHHLCTYHQPPPFLHPCPEAIPSQEMSSYKNRCCCWHEQLETIPADYLCFLLLLKYNVWHHYPPLPFSAT